MRIALIAVVLIAACRGPPRPSFIMGVSKFDIDTCEVKDGAFLRSGTIDVVATDHGRG